jgi:hypothetical protein
MEVCVMDMEVSVSHELKDKYSGVSVSIERISPDRARLYLERNTKNRRLNRRHAERFRDAMRYGDWWMNGETIIFSSAGSLLNGQHRLWAIVDSGVSIDAMVVRGIDEEAFKTIDGVRSRRASDILQMDGEKSATEVAAAVQALLMFVDSGGVVGSGSTNRARKATAAMCDRVLSVHPGLRDSVFQMKRNSLFKNQYAHLLHYLFSTVNRPLADCFADVLADGSSDMGRPYVLFRESLVRTPMRSDLRRSYCAKAIKAFNAEQLGERPKMLKVGDKEDFPAIIGLDYERLANSV